MKEVKKGEVYYYNNGKVTILKVENENFALVVGDKDIHISVNGSNFCAACMVGGISGAPITHKCSDVDDIIEEVVEDINEQDIFWVNIKHLQDKPFEYKKWEKITEENDKMCLEISKKKKTGEALSLENEALTVNRETLMKDTDSLIDTKAKLLVDIEEIKQQKQQVMIDRTQVMDLRNSSKKISVHQIIEYIKKSLLLDCLEVGGVDNWEWYSESLPECDGTTDEYFETKAIEELFNL